MLSDNQIDEFEQWGMTCCPSLMSDAEISSARALVYDTLNRAKLAEGETWRSDPPGAAEAAKIAKRVRERCKKSEPFKGLVNEAVSGIVEQLAKEPTTQLLPYSQALFTAPGTGHWSIPNKMWHLDAPRIAGGTTPGVQMFVLLDELKPRGGGTLLVAGSHRFFNSEKYLASKDVKRKLKRYEWFNQLLGAEGFGEEILEEVASVGGQDCKVVELSGKAGDVFFTDLRLLHTLAPNIRDTPRIMATQRFVITKHLVEVYGPGAVRAQDDSPL